MIVTRTAIEIAASPAAIFALASATERWPAILPHYRYVRVIEQLGSSRLVAMGARHDGIPIGWVARQTNDASTPHIAFHHLRGWTRGMDVEWIFEPHGDRTRVTIEHRLAFRFPFAADWLGKHVVCDYFVDGVANKTLATIKRLAEQGA
ncbi:MAG TPA: SRPBCC family protein [Candidatus Sulfotelmatobacter sp.]|nr:SRPBCC family protein [Candidatus Sulfotelmatobacter sp.]